jgi:hypothetical protein
VPEKKQLVAALLICSVRFKKGDAKEILCCVEEVFRWHPSALFAN